MKTMKTNENNKNNDGQNEDKFNIYRVSDFLLIS